MARIVKLAVDGTIQNVDPFAVVRKKRFGLNSTDHISDGLDASIVEAAPNNNYESDTTLKIGQAASADTRTIFRFNQLTALALGRRCFSATLNFYVSVVAGTGMQGTLGTYIVLRDTDDLGNTTWNISKTGPIAWNTAGCNATGALTEDSTIDRYSVAVATQTGLTTTGWKSVDVTTWVQELTAGTITGYGILLLDSAPAGVNQNVDIVSCDGADGSRPYVEVEYI